MATDRDWELTKASLGVQHKYEFFLAGLTAAVLSFSVQFSEPTLTWVDWVLVAAWVALLVSLVAGISRLSWHAPFLRMQRRLEAKERAAARVEEARAAGIGGVEAGTLRPLRPEEITEIGETLRTTSEKWRKELEGEGWWFTMRYQVQVWAFYVGLTLYALYRVVPLAIPK